MKVDYDKISDCLVDKKTGKAIKTTSDTFEASLVDYILGLVSEGRSVSSIIPKNSKIFPSRVELEQILQKKEYTEARNLAKSLGEQAIIDAVQDAADVYKETQTAEARDYLKARMIIKQETLKSKDKKAPISVNFYSWVDEKGWEKHLGKVDKGEA